MICNCVYNDEMFVVSAICQLWWLVCHRINAYPGMFWLFGLTCTNDLVILSKGLLHTVLNVKCELLSVMGYYCL